MLKTNKQTNKQNKHRKVIQKILSPAVWGKKNLTQTKSPISPLPLLPLKSQMVDPYSVRIQSHVQAFKQEEQDVLACGEKQQQQPELPKGEFRPARAMCM